ncbi:MAG: polysaccharide deacetylase family protein [Clostridia bacterium]|nr:polysaccharide deacetylase family protein [Clostridia bacterium]
MAKKIIALIVFACTLLTLLVPVSFAADESSTTPISAEIAEVYGGRDGMISMTFDDGYYETAVLLQELFEQYDLYGSLMLITQYTKLTGTGSQYGSVEGLSALFEQGRLEPQNHSYSHTRLDSTGDPNDQTEAVFEREMLDSKTTLEEYFPDYDFISFAIPYGSMTDAAHQYGNPIYYALRTTGIGVQSLDPGFSNSYGSWNKMYSPGVMQPQYREDPDAQWTWIKKCIDDAANSWYLPIIHRVGDVENTDLPLEVAHKMFSYISDLQTEGKVWVTTYSNAIKYVRERQNSYAQAWEEDGVIHLRVTMNEYTEDNKPLPLDVFNHPLTVKVNVPSSYGTVRYTIDGVEHTAKAFSEGDENYVYVNVRPDGSDIKLRIDSTHTYGEWTKHDADYHERVCTDCGVLNYGAHNWDEGTVVEEATCMDEGLKICTCLDCGETSERTVDTNDNHSFTVERKTAAYRAEEANCQHGDIYYYSCACGEKGTETFESGKKEEHEFGKWKYPKPATETEDGYKERVCEYGCGEFEREVIPKTGTSDTEPKNTMTTVIIIAAGAVVLVGAAVVTIVIVKKKKKTAE